MQGRGMSWEWYAYLGIAVICVMPFARTAMKSLAMGMRMNSEDVAVAAFIGLAGALFWPVVWVVWFIYNRLKENETDTVDRTQSRS